MDNDTHSRYLLYHDIHDTHTSINTHVHPLGDVVDDTTSSTSTSTGGTTGASGGGGARGRSSMVNTIHLGLAFCFIMLAFMVAQYSQTSLSPSVGATSLAIYYGIFTLSNTVSAYTVSVAGLRLSLIVGALTYTAYVAANIHANDVVLYTVSAVLGMGAAMMWTAQGQFVAQCSQTHEVARHLPSNSTVGLFNGVFFSVSKVNLFAGNFMAALLYQGSVDDSVVFAIMTGLCGVGVFIMLFLPKEFVSQHRGDTGSGISRVLDSLTLLKDRRMLLLVAYIVYTGCEQSFVYGVFPPMIAPANHKFYVLAFLGGLDAVGSFAAGKLSDRIGRMPVLVVGTLAHVAVYLYFLLFSPTLLFGHPLDIPHVWFFVLALGLAIGESVMNTQVYAILGTYFRDRPAQAFAIFKLFQSLATAGLFIFTATSSPSVWACAMIAFSALMTGMVLVALCHVLDPFDGLDDDVHPSGSPCHAKPTASEVLVGGVLMD